MASQNAVSTASEQLGDEDGPYILRPLLEDISLQKEGSEDVVKMNCVEYFDGNLYIGTSASEVLHFVQIPPDPGDKNGRPAFIPASRLSPVSLDSSSSPSAAGPGVQEILLMPRIGKACILCNSTAAFYSLPELSPVSGISVVRKCNWIGGVDLNDMNPDLDNGAPGPADATILLSLKSKIQVVRLADKVLEAPKVTFAGSILSVRRDSIACVADSKAYALLDIHRRLTIPLMNISTLEEPTSDEGGDSQPPANAPLDVGVPAEPPDTPASKRVRSPGHSRNSSEITGSPTRQQIPPQDQTTASFRAQIGDHSSLPTTDKPLPAAPAEAGPPGGDADAGTGPGTGTGTGTEAQHRPLSLKPHIVSPSSDEFLLVIGTKSSEPGVGMFVSLDGEPSRATIQFDRYPEQVVIDASTADVAMSQTGSEEQEDGHVIASICKSSSGESRYGLEIQHVNAGQEANPYKYWLEARSVPRNEPYGLRSLMGQGQVFLSEIVLKLSQKRYSPFPGSLEASASSLRSTDSRTAVSIEQLSQEKELFERDDLQEDEALPEGWEAARIAEGEEFTRRLAMTQGKLVVWNGNRIWWALRNPLVLQLDSLLEASCPRGKLSINRHSIYAVLGRIRDREAKTELEFMSLDYLRQKAGLLLLIGALSSSQTQPASDAELNTIEQILVDSKLDVRVVLSLIPGIRNDIIEGRRGVWIYAGVKSIADFFLPSMATEAPARKALQTLDLGVMHFLRRFLSSWRKMKGFGSVADEGEVFRTVDATLLIILLELDERSPRGPGKRGGAIRAELNDLVDGGVDCFDRAVDVLESYGRLFVLSRLYQSRKMAGDVLATWRRIIEGEEDGMHEFQDGERRVRDYLKKISSVALVHEYGIWLANRNPRLGVEVFAEDGGRAPRFAPARAVEILRAEAPGAVKYYLEHLVFDKGQTAYVDELLKHYLDVVLGDLHSSPESREAVMAAYGAYRALQAPKPSYQHFLQENAPPENEVWNSRLRLLQLLGGSHDYDAAAVARRIESLPGDLLVPETIILAGHQRRHEEALRLLVHRLGDYDTAVAYCLRGGSNVYARPEVGQEEERRRRRRRQGGQGQGGDGNTMAAAEAALQHRLFRVVLDEFLRIADVSDRVEQTGALLERFGGWFQVEEVLRLIPDTWSVDVVGGFLTGALSRLVREKKESAIKRALSGAENLRVSDDLVSAVAEGRHQTDGVVL